MGTMIDISSDLWQKELNSRSKSHDMNDKSDNASLLGSIKVTSELFKSSRFTEQNKQCILPHSSHDISFGFISGNKPEWAIYNTSSDIDWTSELDEDESTDQLEGDEIISSSQIYKKSKIKNVSLTESLGHYIIALPATDISSRFSHVCPAGYKTGVTTLVPTYYGGNDYVCRTFLAFHVSVIFSPTIATSPGTINDNGKAVAVSHTFRAGDLVYYQSMTDGQTQEKVRSWDERPNHYQL